MGLKRNSKNWLEWSIFAIGFILFGACVLFLSFKAAKTRAKDLNVEFKVVRVEKSDPGYRIHAEAHNAGDQPVESLLIEAALQFQSDSKEVIEVELDLLPHDSTREFVVHFQADPNTGKLTFRPVRYSIP